MASAGLQPWPEFDPGAGEFLTFVVPAPSGCNLKCSFCLVRQRRETDETHLQPEDYARFISEAVERRKTVALAIQGYEPLLPESMPYTQAILARGRFLNLPTSLVTNGVNLYDTVGQLKTLSPSKIAISLDAASADVHDRIRGVAGTWDAAVKGIERALADLTPQKTSVVVSSVLQPSKRDYLDDMPARLREIGIGRWIVTPLLRVGVNHVGGPAGEQARLFRDLIRLQEAADRAGIRLTIDDEFGHLNRDAACTFHASLPRLIRTLPEHVELFRLTPGGHCSRGNDVLMQVSSETPRWQPDTHAGDFIDRLS